MIKFLGLLTLFVASFSISAEGQNKLKNLQNTEHAKSSDSTFNGFVFPPHDSILHINMGVIELIGPYPFKNKREERKYNQFEKDVLKTYPLALIVGSELKIVNAQLESSYTDLKRRKIYIKWYEKYVYKTYIDSLKSLNVQQGRLLLKLIHRETGKTPYDLIRSYRGGFQAVLWQSLALMAGANLNSTYDAEENKMIEHIIQRYKSGEFN